MYDDFTPAQLALLVGPQGDQGDQGRLRATKEKAIRAIKETC